MVSLARGRWPDGHVRPTPGAVNFILYPVGTPMLDCTPMFDCTPTLDCTLCGARMRESATLACVLSPPSLAPLPSLGLPPPRAPVARQARHS